MSNLNDLELKYVDQRYDGLEAWIRFKESDWIRLDVFLEYYLSRKVSLTTEYKGQLKDESVAKRYYKLLFDLFSEKTSRGESFDFEKYHSWVNDPSEISNVAKLL